MKLSGGKKTAAGDAAYAHHEHENDIGSPATKMGRSLLLLATLLGFGFLIILIVGTALLQSWTNDRRFLGNTSVLGSYNDAFQSAHYTPYPDKHSRQWMMLWWIISVSAVTWLMTLLLAVRAAVIVQWRPALIGFHIYVLVLCTFVIDSFLWLSYRNYTNVFFGGKRFKTALAGLFGLAIAHALAALALGMIASRRHLDNRHINTGIRERVVERQVEVPMQSQHEHHETVETRMADSAPVRVHAGETLVTDPLPGGRTAPVQVHQGGILPKAGARELGTQRY